VLGVPLRDLFGETPKDGKSAKNRQIEGPFLLARSGYARGMRQADGMVFINLVRWLAKGH
jgi:hypothetical protein